MDDLPFDYPAESRPALARAKPHRHRWVKYFVNDVEVGTCCQSCSQVQDPVASRRGRNNRKRGNASELDVARAVGGRKMGPLGLPWDVEMTGYARLQVKKLATAPSLRFVAGELARIGSGGPLMSGFVWIEPGRNGERLIVFRLADFAARHGVEVES